MANFQQWTPTLWRIALAVMVFICLALAVIFWLSGKSETRDAFAAGRRLIIRLDDSTIQGKIVRPNEVMPNAETNDKSTALPDGNVAIVPTVPKELPSLELPADDTAAVPTGATMQAQNPSLMEKTEAGLLPIIGKDGTKPWRYYAKPFQRKSGQAMIAIIVEGLGENKALGEAAIKLPENVTLSFSPYAKDLANWSSSARATGHEIVMDLPLEPVNYPSSDPGPNALLINKAPNVNETNLEWVMARLPVYVGFLTSPTEGFSSSNDSFRLLLQSLANRGLLLVMSREPGKKETKELIDSSNTATVISDVLIDEDLSPTAIEARLTTLEQMAKKSGFAVGIAQPYMLTIEQIKQWAPTLAEKGFVLVPISTIAKLHFS